MKNTENSQVDSSGVSLAQPDPILRLYALVRSDLGMNVGKVASQAGHAYLGAYLKAPTQVQEEYHSDGIGTKVCLVCPSAEKLLEVYNLCQQLEQPCSLIEDSGVGSGFSVPTITALGIGPINKEQARFLKKFQLMK